MYGIAANVIADSSLRRGAKVFILTVNGDAEKPLVYGLARDGKMIHKFIPYKRLKNFRAKWIPEHLRNVELFGWQFASREVAEREAYCLDLMWTNIRAYDSEGNRIKEGLPASKAFDMKIRFVERSILAAEKD